MNFDQQLSEALNAELIARFEQHRKSLVKKTTFRYVAPDRPVDPAETDKDFKEPTKVMQVPGYCMELLELATSDGIDAYEGAVYLVDIDPNELKEMPFEWCNIGFLDEYKSQINYPLLYLLDELSNIKSYEDAEAVLQKFNIKIDPRIIISSICYQIKPGIKKTVKKPGDYKTEVLVNVECGMQLLFTESEFTELLKFTK